MSDATGSGARRRVAAAAIALLELTGRPRSELSVTLVADSAMRKLNRDWRGRDRTTDVLSFPLAGDTPTSGKDSAAQAHLGDIVISVPVARRQARAGGWTLQEELNRLLLHGLLHLLGYDHESGGREEARMRAEEARLAAALIENGLSCAHEQPERARRVRARTPAARSGTKRTRPVAKVPRVIARATTAGARIGKSGR